MLRDKCDLRPAVMVALGVLVATLTLRHGDGGVPREPMASESVSTLQQRGGEPGREQERT